MTNMTMAAIERREELRSANKESEKERHARFMELENLKHQHIMAEIAAMKDAKITKLIRQ